MITAVRIFKCQFIRFISIILLLVVFFFSFTSTHVFAQDESTQLDKELYPEKSKKKEKPSGFKKKLIQINEDVALEINKAAEGIDKSVSPTTPDLPGMVVKNKTQIFFIMGGDFDDRGNMETNFRFGANLHLPRFEKYWSVKFANQDEKKDRGTSSVVRRQRTRNTNDDVFVGVSFFRNWDNIEVTYKPQIAIKHGVGLDHSIEAETNYEFGRFTFEPSLEFFANHDEGTGFSSALQFIYKITDKISFLQGNDARFVNLTNSLSVNHSVGFGFTPTEKLALGTHYFRSFRNERFGYELAAYGTYIASNYKLYKEVLSLEAKPYIVYEREDNFDETYGILVNFRVNF